jgi:hypothetical protein
MNEWMTEWMNELQYQDVSTYLRAWYKGKKNDSPIELGSDLGLEVLCEGFKITPRALYDCIVRS